jgi:hypothetical protein
MPIPAFREDGYLPEGLHEASEDERDCFWPSFSAYSPEMWNGWVEFFSQTREADARRKGVVEVAL